jgi:hypothetical protein
MDNKIIRRSGPSYSKLNAFTRITQRKAQVVYDGQRALWCDPHKKYKEHPYWITWPNQMMHGIDVLIARAHWQGRQRSNLQSPS